MTDYETLIFLYFKKVWVNRFSGHVFNLKIQKNSVLASLKKESDFEGGNQHHFWQLERKDGQLKDS